MKKYFTIAVVFLSLTLTGCDPFVTYTQDELRIITKDMSNFLHDPATTISYEFKTRGEIDTFMRVDRSDGLRCIYRIVEGGREIDWRYYENGTLYINDNVRHTKQKRSADVSELYYLHEAEIFLHSIGRLLDYKYISDVSSWGLIKSRESPPSLMNIDYKIDVASVLIPLSNITVE